MIGRIGGLLIAAGALVLVAALAFEVAGGSIGIGGASLPSLLLAVGDALIGAGVGILVVAGRGWFGASITRAGGGVLAIGLLSLAAFSFASVAYPGDPLESLALIWLGGIGVVGLVLGLLLTGSSLAWRMLRYRSAS